jgi:hypothetical protein
MSIKLSEPMAMISSLSIAPSPMDRGNGPETRPGIKSRKQGDVIPNLPTQAGTPALQGGEEVRNRLQQLKYNYFLRLGINHSACSQYVKRF